MKAYLFKNYKIFLSIISSFIIVFFIVPFFMTPGKLTRTVGNFTKFWTGQDLSLLTKLFTIKFSENNNLAQVQPYESIDMNGINNGTPPVYVPPTKIIKPTNMIGSENPTPTEDDELVDFPFESGSENNIPTPTKYNRVPTGTRPTKPPKPSPTPLAPPGYLRPGTGLEDIFKIAGELACVPPALLKSFVAQEAPGVLNWSDQTALFYNAYDWWHRVKDKSQVCGGYAYYTHTGLIPEDSLFAGERCKDPFSPETANDTYSRLLGSCQMLQSYWEKDYKNPTKQKLKVDQVDRRVLIDCLVGYGIHFRQDTGYSGSCSGDWDMKYVAKAACVNAGGSCDQYNYCTLICNNYNKFAHKNYSCGGAAGLFVPGSYCQFK